MAKITVFIADGTEEIEALTVVDLARRAGIEVDTVSVNDSTTVTGSHNIKIILDAVIGQVAWDAVDMIVLPGGKVGVDNLKACTKLTDKLQEFARDGKPLAAVCAAPSILGGLGLLDGKKATCYPGFEDKLTGAEYVKEPVVKDGNIITSRGLGTSIQFAAAIIEYLVGKDTADKVLNQIIYND
ncbi:MAG: DJ-1/PfpI family protein [Lachnospiraceae bacterium]|nr:DJ-1/PfpI family protein [Lachnospiraceae bacterium]